LILSGCLAEEKRVRLTIFWRVILAQLTLIVLLLGMSLYALVQLHHLAGLSTDLLDTDSKSIEAEKYLLKSFLSQRRIAEKYLVAPDK
jgi:membrane-anchored protein YejM (alkaline phosphatase superfamily)